MVNTIRPSPRLEDRGTKRSFRAATRMNNAPKSWFGARLFHYASACHDARKRADMRMNLPDTVEYSTVISVVYCRCGVNSGVYEPESKPTAINDCAERARRAARGHAHRDTGVELHAERRSRSSPHPVGRNPRATGGSRVLRAGSQEAGLAWLLIALGDAH